MPGRRVRTIKIAPCKRIQVDEVWCFAYCKQANRVTAKAAPPNAGDCWTWTALCADTKLMPSWLVGSRDTDAAMGFIADLSGRLAHRVQLTSDGHRPYLEAVEAAFGADIDYAMLNKIYGGTVEGEKRYSPAKFVGCSTKVVTGNPDEKHISTSYVERNNLTMRMHMRRFTRLTNAFSKKVENHAHAVALFAMYYNFVKLHKAHRLTPAMAAGVTDRLWEGADIVNVLQDWEHDRS
jgi:IS1 family transposase